MSILNEIFGSLPLGGLYDSIGLGMNINQYFNLQQGISAQEAAMKEYYQQYSNNQKSQETMKQEVKDDPNVIDAEFEVVEVKELEFKK